MIWMDVDVALSEVPVNAVGLTDDSDFKSLETSVAYNAAGMSLEWHFVTTAGAYTVTSVTPTTGGTYDWAHQGKAKYTIEIPATGGASINNDTEGYGWFEGSATGVLPWRGPTIGFRAAALNDALIDGGDLLDVSVTQLGGVTQSLTDLKDFADTGYDPSTHKVAGLTALGFTFAASDFGAASLNGKGDWNVGKTGYSLTQAFPSNFASLGINASGHISRVVLVDTTTANTDMRGTDSAATAVALAALVTTVGVAGAGLTEAGGTGDQFSAIPWNAAWDAEVQSECADALGVYDGPTNAEMEARTLLAASYFDPAADTVAHVTLVDTTTDLTNGGGGSAPTAEEIADEVATREHILTSDYDAAKSAASQSSVNALPTAAAIVDAIKAYSVEANLTFHEAIQHIAAAHLGKVTDPRTANETFYRAFTDEALFLTNGTEDGARNPTKIT